MKILVVHNRDIYAFPPVKSLIENLLNNGHNITVICKDEKGILEQYNNEHMRVIKLIAYTQKGKLKNIFYFFRNRRRIRKLVRECMKFNDIIWTTTDAAIREVGPQLLKYKHVMQLFELIEYLPLFPKQKIFKYNIQKYAKKAWKVVVPERNRAYIQKVWWNLDTTPTVLPNKPYSLACDNVPNELALYLNMIENEKRKVILYQGVFLPDREIGIFAEAVDRVKDEYCLYIMGEDTKYRKELCEKHPNIVYIPFARAPYHLLITEKADIGLLPYFPTAFENNSIINALYCAPNKIYEYAAYGLPMLGTNVLGLLEPFEKYKIGICCKELTVENILHALQVIDKNYVQMSSNCIKFFNDIDLDEIVEKILS